MHRINMAALHVFALVAGKPSKHMRRYFMGVGASLMTIGILFACHVVGVLASPQFQRSATFIALAILAFYSMFRCQFNLRFSDPSLSFPQMLAATLVILDAMYGAQWGRAVFVVLLMMIFMFGLLGGLSTRLLLVFVAGILFGYGAVIGLLWQFKRESLDLHLELLQWLALAITLPWFALMGGYNNGLRDRLRQNCKQLQLLLERVQASEASLTQAQRIAGLGGWTFAPLQRSATWSLETYRLFGVDPARSVPVGEQFLSLVHPEDRSSFSALIAKSLRKRCDFNEQFRILLHTGEIRWVHALAMPVVDADGNAMGLSGTVMNITERKAREDETHRLAFYDQLTNLPNRRLLVDRLDQALAVTMRSKHHRGLLFIDLDNFKAINDTLGHDKGDLLLQLVAARLSRCVRAGDTVARLGGDEFVVLLMDLSDGRDDAQIELEAIGANILAALGQSYDLAGLDYHNTASIGATLFLAQHASVDEQLKRADLAMYQAKACGRNRLRFFET